MLEHEIYIDGNPTPSYHRIEEFSSLNIYHHNARRKRKKNRVSRRIAPPVSYVVRYRISPSPIPQHYSSSRISSSTSISSSQVREYPSGFSHIHIHIHTHIWTSGLPDLTSPHRAKARAAGLRSLPFLRLLLLPSHHRRYSTSRHAVLSCLDGPGHQSTSTASRVL